MSDNRRARRYARALYALAREQQQEAAWEEILARLVEALDPEALQEVLLHPQLGGPQRWEMVLRVLESGGVSLSLPVFQNLLRLLTNYRSLNLLPQIHRYYWELWERDRGVLRVRLTTAVELTPEEVARVRQGLVQQLGHEISLETRVDPEILGGAILQIGDRMVDGSLRTRLRQIRDQLVA